MTTTNESSIDCKTIGLCPTVNISLPDLSVSNISYQKGLEEASFGGLFCQFLGFFLVPRKRRGLELLDSPEIAPDSRQTQGR